MQMKSKQRLMWCAGLLLGLWAAVPARAADANTDIQRQLQQRDQQQMELRLKMQQQLDRSTRPPQTPSADLRMRQLDRDQQQRLQQLHEQQTRGMVPPVAPAGAEQMRRDLEHQRALKAGADQLNRFGSQRQLETIDTGSGP
jgi:hypothetical protein